MFNAGLSLDQAPPISVILRFFLTMPLFGLLAGMLMLQAHDELLGSLAAPAFVALTHLVLLGIAAQAMTGALFQMLPVLAGAVVENPLRYARPVHLLLSLGSLVIVYAFWTQHYALLGIGALLAAGTLGFFALVMLRKLKRVQNKTAAVRGMMVALVSLLVALTAALAMGVEYGTEYVTQLHEELRQLHLHFMLFGWIATLIVSVSFQVIEMFYVTPPFPAWMQHYFLPLLFTLLTLQAIASFAAPQYASLFDIPIGLALLFYALLTLRRLAQRKRPLADATVQLWRTGMVALSVSVLLYFVGAPAAAALAFGYGVLSVIYAMSYKIVPFLVWFHLNAKGVMECPMMGDVIPAMFARYHLQLYWSVGVMLAFALLVPELFIAAGALFILLNLFYAYNLGKAAMLYYSLKDKGIL